MWPCFGLFYSPFSAYCSSIVVNNRPEADVIYQLATQELVAMPIAQSFCAGEKGVDQVQCYEPQVGQGYCRVLLPLVCILFCRIDHHGFWML